MTSRLSLIVLALTAAPAVAADDKPKIPLERTTNDRQIVDTLAVIHDRGAALYDAGDANGCYRLFQGGIIAVRISLPADLQKEIDDGLADADRLPTMSQRAMLLHRLIEDIRKKLHKTAGPKIKAAPLPLPRPVTTGAATPEPPLNLDKAVKIEPPVVPGDRTAKPAAPVGPPVVPVNTPNKGTPAPVTTAPPSDDPPPGQKLPFTPIIPKPDGK